MKIQLHSTYVVVTREPNDSRVRKSTPYGGVGTGGNYIDPDSQFWHEVKKTLRAMGFDVIKKRMCSDGHLVDDLQQYVRTRDCRLALWYGDWVINGAIEEYNESGTVTLLREDLTT